jgi:hypothetical protein
MRAANFGFVLKNTINSSQSCVRARKSKLLFAITFFARCLPGTIGEAKGGAMAPAKMPDTAYGPKGEALVLPQLQGHTGELQWPANLISYRNSARLNCMSRYLWAPGDS